MEIFSSPYRFEILNTASHLDEGCLQREMFPLEAERLASRSAVIFAEAYTRLFCS